MLATADDPPRAAVGPFISPEMAVGCFPDLSTVVAVTSVGLDTPGMQELLVLAIAVLAALVVVMWARTRAAANSQFERWRDREVASIEARASKQALDSAAIELQRWQADRETEIRRDAIARSGSVVMGKATEQLAPFLGGFRYNPRDVRFLGSPVDLVVFDGLEDGAVRGVVFVEVKSGAGQLSTRQRQVRDALKRGSVSWEEWRPPGT